MLLPLQLNNLLEPQAGALVGSSSLTFSTSGTLTGTANVTGSSSLTFTTSALLGGTFPLTGSSSLTFTPAATLTDASAPVVVATNKGGRARKGRRRYYVVEVDGQDFIVTSQAEVRGLLQQAKALAEQAALTEAEKPQNERKVPRIRVRTGSGNKTSSIAIQREIRDTRAEIERIYSDAARKVAEIRKVAERTQQALQDEEDAIIALLM